MGGIPRPILAVVWIALLLAAGGGFTLGFTGSTHKAATAEDAPIATNLPANVVIKDAQPFVQPAPAPPKPKAQAAAASDDAPDDSDEAPVEPQARAPRPAPDIPPPINPVPSTSGPALPGDLPPT